MISRYAVTMTGRIVGAAAQTVVLVMLVRALGLSEYAPFALSFSLCTTIFVCLDLGFGAAILRSKAVKSRDRLFGTLIVVRILTTISAAGCLLAVFALRGDISSIDIGLIAILYASGEALGDLAIGIAQSELRSRRAVAILLSRRSVALAPLLISPTIPGAITALVAAGLLGHTLFWLAAIRRAGAPLTVKDTFNHVGTLTVSSVGTGVTSADSFLISLVTTAHNVGYYAAASRLANPVNLAVSTLIQVLIPHLISVERQQRLATFRRARLLVVALGLCVASSAFFAPELVQALYGRDFLPAAPVLAGVLVGAGISAVAQIHLAWLYADGIQWSASLLVLAGSLIGLSGLAITVTLGGLVTAGVGVALMQAVICTAVVVAWRRAIKAERLVARATSAQPVATEEAPNEIRS